MTQENQEVCQERLEELLDTPLAVSAWEHLESANQPRLQRLLAEEQGNHSLALFLAKETERAMWYEYSLQEKQPDLPYATRMEMTLQFLMDQIGTEVMEEPMLLTEHQQRQLHLFLEEYHFE